jgi:murein DD-endopeptidase MepM/ murein hydrolase activator NlpD
MPAPAVVALLSLFLAVPPSSAAPRADAFRWPVTPPAVLRRFDPPPQPWLAGHRGVDLGSSAGAVVRAAGDGVVVHAQTLAGRGVVSIAHAGRLRTTYEPVTATVQVGDRVAAGDPVGVVEAGHPGCAVPVCLHWGARRDTVYLDPLALLGLGRIRLLPLGAVPASGAVTQRW